MLALRIIPLLWGLNYLLLAHDSIAAADIHALLKTAAKSRGNVEGISGARL